MAKIFQSQISIPTDATESEHVVPKGQLDNHAGDFNIHIPPGGLPGQVLVKPDVYSPMVWKTPQAICPNGGNAEIIFTDDPFPPTVPDPDDGSTWFRVYQVISVPTDEMWQLVEHVPNRGTVEDPLYVLTFRLSQTSYYVFEPMVFFDADVNTAVFGYGLTEMSQNWPDGILRTFNGKYCYFLSGFGSQPGVPNTLNLRATDTPNDPDREFVMRVRINTVS